jgi:hypothetical protein
LLPAGKGKYAGYEKRSEQPLPARRSLPAYSFPAIGVCSFTPPSGCALAVPGNHWHFNCHTPSFRKNSHNKIKPSGNPAGFRTIPIFPGLKRSPAVCRFAHKAPKNRLSADFLPYKLLQQAPRDQAAQDAAYCGHPEPAVYGIGLCKAGREMIM